MSAFLTLFDLVGVLAARRFQLAERSFAAIGLSHTEARLLTVLHAMGGEARQDELSDQILIDRSNATRALKRLEDRGMIVRSRAQSDGRANQVEISRSGRLAVRRISTLKKAMAESFFRDLSEADAAAIIDLLRPALSEEENAARARPPGMRR